jgi:putative peptidoglycan lipid II flippase
MLKGVLTVGGWTMASRVLGLLREMLIAALAGAGPVSDAFFIAWRLPNLFRRLFGEGAFNAAFVPAFSGLLASEGKQAANAFAAEAVGVMVFWLAGLTILGEIFMPELMRVLAPGFYHEAAKFSLVVTFARITFPYLLLICLTALLSGVLNGLDRFAAAAAAPVVFNCFSIAAMLLLAPHLPTVGHALSWGVTLSGIAQLGLMVVAVRRAGMTMRIPRPRMTPQMRLLLRRMGPGLLGAGVFQLNLMMDTIVASLLPGDAVSYLNYADRINQLPLGIIGFAIGTAILPLLSRQVRAGDEAAAIETMNRGLEYALLLTLPAALALGVTATPIVYGLYGHGAFHYASAVLSAQSLAAYAIGLPAAIVVKVLAPGFFARNDTGTPVRVAIAAVVLNLGLNLLLMRPLQHVGPPLASSISGIFNCVSLGAVLMRRGHLRPDRKLAARLPRMLAAALCMAVTLWAVQRALAAPLVGPVAIRTGALALLVTLGMGVYGLAGQVLGAFDLRELGTALARRPRRLAKTG